MVNSVEKAVVLMNLGSPDSYEVADVKKYLLEFLMDKRVIDYPWIFRKLLVQGVIVPRRVENSAAAYKSIWWPDGSPLISLTKQLQQAVASDLDLPVEIMMRYGNPHPSVAFDKLQQNYPNLKEVILLPLYPHYAMSSYETAALYAQGIHKKGNYTFSLRTVPPFYKDQSYIDAMAASIEPYVQEEYDFLLFSYHGVPLRHIYKGDVTGSHCLKVGDCCHVDSSAHNYCYKHQVTITSELVAKQLGIPREKWGISFQSRLGKEEWVKPYTADQFEELPGKGVKKLLVSCPAFVSDCLETLEEIGEEGKHTFLNSGGSSFTMIPCLNTHPLWVQSIRKLISVA